MGLTIPARIWGGLVQWTWGVLVETPRFLLKTWKLLGSVVADTAGALWDVLLWKQNKKKNRKEAISDAWKGYKKSNKEDWEHFWAPFEGEWDKSYGLSKLVAYPTHAIYGGIKEGLKTALDFSWRGLLTLPAWAGNMFLKKENRVKLWKGEHGFKSNMKKWRWSYIEGFKQLKTKKKEKEEDKKKEKEEDKKKEKEEKKKDLEAIKEALEKDFESLQEEIQKAWKERYELQEKKDLSEDEKKKIEELNKTIKEKVPKLQELAKKIKGVERAIESL